MKNKGRTEIIGNILNATNGGETKTKIMCQTFLSHNRLKEYLSLLINNNLLEYFEDSKTFKNTEKGFNFS
jgi:predicted transcriptional regulator